MHVSSIVAKSFQDGEETDSQIFDFTDGQESLPLALKNNPETCLVVENGNQLGSAGCSGGAGQKFTLG